MGKRGISLAEDFFSDLCFMRSHITYIWDKSQPNKTTQSYICPPPLFPGKLNPLFLRLRIPNCSITRKKGKEICFDAICGSLPSGLNKNPPTKLKNNDWHCKDGRSNNTTIIEVLLCTRRPSNRAFHKISTRIFFVLFPLPLLSCLKRRDVQIVGMHCMLLAPPPPPPPLLCNQTVSPSPRDLYLQRPPDRLCKNMRRSLLPHTACLSINPSN